jgi:hypothetical protein
MHPLTRWTRVSTPDAVQRVAWLHPRCDVYAAAARPNGIGVSTNGTAAGRKLCRTATGTHGRHAGCAGNKQACILLVLPSPFCAVVLLDGGSEHENPDSGI